MSAQSASPGSQDALRELASRIEFYRELGVYDFYRRGVTPPEHAALSPSTSPSHQSATHAETEPEIPRRSAVNASPTDPVFPLASFGPPLPAAARAGALLAVQELIGDCTRCRLSEGRKKIVFGDGDPNARLMFVGEGPGADEDAQGLPFVGRAGQLLNNMIGAMGLKREQVYIANIVKCRPPGNRKPEPDEAHTCTPFLERQIDVIQPQILVALGATAATYLLGMRGAIAGMRGRLHDYRGIQTIVTYHPAYLLRDPSQKKEAWKDLQMAMAALGLKAPARAPQA